MPTLTKCVVSVKTSRYERGKRFIVERSVTVLKKKSSIVNLLEEEVMMVGVEQALESITNIETVDDGLYELVACNPRTDWETGYVDDYDLKLIPYSDDETDINEDEPCLLGLT